MQKLWRSMKLHRAHIAELCLSLQENETMGKVSPSFHSLSSFKQRPQHCCLHRCFGSSASSVCSVWFYACRFPSVLNRQTSSPAHCIKHRCNDTPREQPLHHSKFQPPNLANSSLSQVSVWLRPEQLKPASSHSAGGCSTALTCCVATCSSEDAEILSDSYSKTTLPAFTEQPDGGWFFQTGMKFRLPLTQCTPRKAVRTPTLAQDLPAQPFCWAQLFINYHLQPQRQLKAEHTGQLTGHPVVPEIRNIRKASESQFRRKK